MGSPTNDLRYGAIVSASRRTRFYFLAAAVRSSTPPLSTSIWDKGHSLY